jgi:hypothetical protein
VKILVGENFGGRLFNSAARTKRGSSSNKNKKYKITIEILVRILTRCSTSSDNRMVTRSLERMSHFSQTNLNSNGSVLLFFINFNKSNEEEEQEVAFFVKQASNYALSRNNDNKTTNSNKGLIHSKYSSNK